MLNMRRRDHRVLNFISDFGCATTSQLRSLFFPDVSLRRCQDRMTILQGWDKVKRDRDSLNTDFLYYMSSKPREIQHMLARVDFYIWADSKYLLNEFVCEYQVGKLRADAYFEVYRNGYNIPYFLEVQISPYFRQYKYEKYYESGEWVDKWEHFPSVIVLSDHKMRFKESAIRFIHYPQELQEVVGF